MININEVLRLAGLPLREEDLAQHVKKEERLFVDCCSCLKDVMKMCEERLNDPATGDITPEQKKQYTDLHACAKHCCEVMSKHRESYK